MGKKLNKAKPVKVPFTFDECNSIIEVLEFQIRFGVSQNNDYIRSLIARFQTQKEYLVQAGIIPR